MPNYEIDSFKIEYAEFGTGPDRLEVRANDRVEATTPTRVINKLRDVLLAAGWSFINPYPDVPLGVGTLIEHRIPLDSNGNASGIELEVATGVEDFSTGRQYLLVTRTTGPLYPPTLYRVIGVAGSVFTVTVESGEDRAWVAGSAVRQIRGIAAEGTLFVPGFSDASMLGSMGFKDSQGNQTGLAPGEPPTCGQYSSPGNYGFGGVCAFLGMINLCMQNDWRFGERNIRISPLLGYFQTIVATVTLGRDHVTGTINGTNDNTGPIGNTPTVRFPAPTSPFYNGVPSHDIFGGGWAMLSYPSPIGISFGVAITENQAGAVSLRFLNHGSAISNPNTVTNHSCPPSDFNDNFFLPRIFGAPDYTLFVGASRFGITTPIYSIIANPYQFFVVDQVNVSDAVGAFGSGGNSIYAGVPFIDPSRTPGLTTCAIVVGPGQLMTNMTWRSFPSSIALNGDYSTFTAGSSDVGLSTLGVGTLIFSFGQPVKTSNDKPLLVNAYLWASDALGTESSILGKIYDGVVTSDVLVRGNRFRVDGHEFEVVSVQNSAPLCSLAVCTSPTTIDNF